MSLRPTPANRAIFGLALSAVGWARNAIGAGKKSGPEGFERYRSHGGWYYPEHYARISQTNPEFSPPEASDEMADIRMNLVREIEIHAKELDAMIMRLQRMEEQMAMVLESSAGGEAGSGPRN